MRLWHPNLTDLADPRLFCTWAFVLCIFGCVGQDKVASPDNCLAKDLYDCFGSFTHKPTTKQKVDFLVRARGCWHELEGSFFVEGNREALQKNVWTLFRIGGSYDAETEAFFSRYLCWATTEALKIYRPQSRAPTAGVTCRRQQQLPVFLAEALQVQLSTSSGEHAQHLEQAIKELWKLEYGEQDDAEEGLDFGDVWDHMDAGVPTPPHNILIHQLNSAKRDLVRSCDSVKLIDIPAFSMSRASNDRRKYFVDFGFDDIREFSDDVSLSFLAELGCRHTRDGCCGAPGPNTSFLLLLAQRTKSPSYVVLNKGTPVILVCEVPEKYCFRGENTSPMDKASPKGKFLAVFKVEMLPVEGLPDGTWDGLIDVSKTGDIYFLSGESLANWVTVVGVSLSHGSSE